MNHFMSAKMDEMMRFLDSEDPSFEMGNFLTPPRVLGLKPRSVDAWADDRQMGASNADEAAPLVNSSHTSSRQIVFSNVNGEKEIHETTQQCVNGRCTSSSLGKRFPAQDRNTANYADVDETE